MTSLAPDFQFSFHGLQISGYAGAGRLCPAVYLHLSEGSSEKTAQELLENIERPFSLVTIGVPSEKWSVILAPWDTPADYPAYAACKGGAPDYLKCLIEEILPACEAKLPAVSWRGLAGYSLAGLFSLYALCMAPETFDRIMCASGSFWYPDFSSWFLAHPPNPLPQSVYFSCGKAEIRSRSRIFSAVGPVTSMIEAWFEQHQVPSVLVLQPGGHHTDPAGRLLEGLGWILEHPFDEKPSKKTEMKGS